MRQLTKEGERLVALGKQLKKLILIATAHMVNATAFYGIKMKTEAMESVEKALEITVDKLDTLDEAYPIWRSAMMIKAALLVAEKRKQKEALNCYQEIADQAAQRGDAFYAMEAYRVRAHMFYHSRKPDVAWENIIFSLQAGTNLDIDFRRSSSFLFSAALALQIAEDKGEYEQADTLKERFIQYIGEDWEKLLEGTDVTIKKVKPPKPAKV